MGTKGVDITGSSVPVIDYEGSRYQTDFWVGQGRDYEDAAERRALKRLLPPGGPGRRIAEIGAGFGRLGDLYEGYEQVILFDYSRTLLAEAAQRWGGDGRFVFVAGNVYRLPLVSGLLDALVMVRVMHHLAQVPTALAQLHRVLHGESVVVLEYANKRNLKALARWVLRRQDWSPLEREPVEYVELNFDFHPAWMNDRLREAGFVVEQRFAVSHFRLPVFKRIASPQQLASADSVLFGVGGQYPLSPSIFVRAHAATGRKPKVQDVAQDVGSLFACPHCRHEGLETVDDRRLRCPQCGRGYGKSNHVWDLKEQVESEYASQAL